MNVGLNSIDFAALSPLLILLGGTLLMLLLETFAENFAKKLCLPFTLLTFGFAIFATVYAPQSESPLLTPWLRFDSLAQFFSIFFLLIGCGSALLAATFFKQFEATHGEYYFLLIASVFGLILIGSAADFLTLFLGVETLSIALYVLCGYMKKWEISHEASLKYFLMGALASAFLLYGIALIYGAIGTTRLSALAQGYHSIATVQEQVLFLGGIALVTLGFAFKAAIVPFHVWAPDVYEGAPTPVTAFMATGTKVGAFAAFAILFLIFLPKFDVRWNEGIAFLAYLTLIYANLVALRQVKMRRFFAYSGIAQAGFMLIPIAAGGNEALTSLLFYLVVYVVATLGAFAALTFLDQRKEGVLMSDLKGLFQRSPFLAGVLALSLLTLAGIPPTAGFLAKFYVFKVAFQAGYYGLVIVGLLTTILSAYYYLRFVTAIFSDSSTKEEIPAKFWQAGLVGLIACVVIIVLSFYPTPFLNFLSIID